MRPQLATFDAIATGLAAILGAGIFAVRPPAAEIAGRALLASLLMAAFVAFCNALSSAQLAAVLPRSRGTYESGRRLLGPWRGFTAGRVFITANTVGPGVMPLAFGGYLHAVLVAIPARPAFQSCSRAWPIGRRIWHLHGKEGPDRLSGEHQSLF